MFNFLFGKKGTVEAVRETQRETLERALGEVNDILALMPEKPPVTVDMASGAISIDLPDQMPDEALALPAPEAPAKDAPGTADETEPKAA